MKPDFASGPPLCVVGNINRDIRLPGVPDSPTLFHDGETSMTRIIETIGGGGANSACAAAALGAKVHFLGNIGQDALGERLRQNLEDHGVRTWLARDKDHLTGSSIALGFRNGHRHFLSCLPNNEHLTFENLDLAALEGCGHLLRADVWFSQSMLETGNERLLTEARRRHLITSLDINFDPCWSTGDTATIRRRKDQLRQVLPLVDLAHGNVRELCEFADAAELHEALGRLVSWGVKAVVVHMGVQGAGYWTAGKLVSAPPSLAENPVHTTGSGDVLSLCMILLHSRTDLWVSEKLQSANQVVREYMEGRRQLIPVI